MLNFKGASRRNRLYFFVVAKQKSKSLIFVIILFLCLWQCSSVSVSFFYFLSLKSSLEKVVDWGSSWYWRKINQKKNQLILRQHWEREVKSSEEVGEKRYKCFECHNQFFSIKKENNPAVWLYWSENQSYQILFLFRNFTLHTNKRCTLLWDKVF